MYTLSQSGHGHACSICIPGGTTTVSGTFALTVDDTLLCKLGMILPATAASLGALSTASPNIGPVVLSLTTDGGDGVGLSAVESQDRFTILVLLSDNFGGIGNGSEAIFSLRFEQCFGSAVIFSKRIEQCFRLGPFGVYKNGSK